MVNADDMLLIEVALRDSRHLEVIMALDRLVILPQTEEALQSAMQDLEAVKEFINKRLPERLRTTAKTMFIEHGRVIASHFRSVLDK
ncbi:hypothetical protein LMG23994_01771 [Cupriavidus pinatubonensis]|uniref:Uncharacterized protein n=2 Tax=Cupriavidus pinatubonensis TaxID=248026 RepID=A0ABM8WRB7_9BURK|nr:hypothetical protein LMG23994_01771 [Cupriavidus pinatubonensis]